MSRVSLTSQVAAVDSVVRGHSGLTRAQADLRTDHLRAARLTLEWCQRNEKSIRTYTDAMSGATPDKRDLIQRLLCVAYSDDCIRDLAAFLNDWGKSGSEESRP